ncbi:MAG: hypothetical protein ACR2IE_20525 [Candidatus Sumerlaeaceae bacterium]
MRLQFEFRSEKFPKLPGEEQRINPGLWGQKLAEYLKENLRRRGFHALQIVAEDWGYIVPIQNEEFELWVGCGHQAGDPDEFLCFIEPQSPVIRRWFRKIDTTAVVSRLSAALEEILSTDPDIWYRPSANS